MRNTLLIWTYHILKFITCLQSWTLIYISDATSILANQLQLLKCFTHLNCFTPELFSLTIFNVRKNILIVTCKIELRDNFSHFKMHKLNQDIKYIQEDKPLAMDSLKNFFYKLHSCISKGIPKGKHFLVGLFYIAVHILFQANIYRQLSIFYNLEGSRIQSKY